MHCTPYYSTVHLVDDFTCQAYSAADVLLFGAMPIVHSCSYRVDASRTSTPPLAGQVMLLM